MKPALPPTIRLVAVHDTEQLLGIYAPIVRETAISFEIEPPTEPEMRQRIIETLAYFPWLVCEYRGEVVGYAYAAKHRSRAAYQWSVDTSVYVQRQAHRMGIGRALYATLFKILVLDSPPIKCC